ncbi:MAG: YtxH domain-containing protein [Anaerolineae bacterium]
MGKASSVLEGLVLGGLLGMVLGLLLAPRSGEETRQLLQDRAEAILAQGQWAAEERRLELTHQFEDLKQPKA